MIIRNASTARMRLMEMQHRFVTYRITEHLNMRNKLKGAYKVVKMHSGNIRKTIHSCQTVIITMNLQNLVSVKNVSQQAGEIIMHLNTFRNINKHCKTQAITIIHRGNTAQNVQKHSEAFRNQERPQAPSRTSRRRGNPQATPRRHGKPQKHQGGMGILRNLKNLKNRKKHSKTLKNVKNILKIIKNIKKH